MTERLEADVAVLGAGPAGLAAATAAARLGASVVALDLYAAPGGQYHMRPRSDLTALVGTGQVTAGIAAAGEAEAAGVRIVTGAEVFWARPGFELFANCQGRALIVSAREVIVASGALEVVNPFPGWTLPGVTTAGGAQRLVKGGARFSGHTVLAGSGPFLIAVAATFAKAGLPLEAMVEASGGDVQRLPLLMRYPERAVEAFSLVAAAWRARRRSYTRHAVVEAIGESRLEAVRIAPVDASGRPDLSASRLIDDVKTLCVGHGFRPNIELTTLLGARHRYDAWTGGWCCDVDPGTGQTSVAGLRAAGETTGIGGARVAALTGTLAGISAAEALGFKPPSRDLRDRLLRRLDRARGFAKALAVAWPPLQPRMDVLPADTILCRCEDVTLGDVRAAIEEGAGDVLGIKMWTRAGMGPCQGRVCGSVVASAAAHHLHSDPSAFGLNRPHLPLRPTPLKVVAAAME